MKKILTVTVIAWAVAASFAALPAKAESAAAMALAKDDIADLVNRWTFYRDQERWEELRAVFHRDGEIHLSWYSGPYDGFVAASKKLAEKGGTKVKHLIGVPVIELHQDRAVSEVNVIIKARIFSPAGEVDVTSYARFYDLLERRGGAWRIFRRTAIYETDRIDPVTQNNLPPALFADVDQFPGALKFLASSMNRLGIQLAPTVVVDDSEPLKELYASGQAWLAGPPNGSGQ